MPGLWTTHARQCERYEGFRNDDDAEGEIEEVSTMVFFRAYILKETYQDYATDPAAKAAITDALVAAGVAVPGEVVAQVAWTLITDGRGVMPQRVAAARREPSRRLRVPVLRAPAGGRRRHRALQRFRWPGLR